MTLERVCQIDLRATILLPLCGLLAGCSSGYSRGEMDAALRAAKPIYVSSELSVEEIERMKPQLKLPARIAIAPPVQTRHGSWGNNSLNTWTSEEVAVIESWREPLRAAGVADDVVVLPSSLVKDCQNRDRQPTRYGPPAATDVGLVECRLKAQRAAAARAHADALLIITFVTATDEYLNPASLLYLSIVGMWLVPASHRDALTIAEGVLLDNRNEYLYAFASGEGEKQSIRPLIYADVMSAVQASRVEALKNFGSRFLEQARLLSIK